jgi:hypothetical protein
MRLTRAHRVRTLHDALPAPGPGRDRGVRWNLLDLDGDIGRDLVVTQACGDPSVGESHWQLYPATCRP